MNVWREEFGTYTIYIYIQYMYNIQCIYIIYIYMIHEQYTYNVYT